MLEGEAFGPNYGTMGTTGAPSVLANGVPAATEEGSVTAVLDGQDSGADRQGCVAYGVADRVQEPPLDVAPRATGLDGAPHERIEEARVSRYPQESLSNLQQPLQQPAGFGMTEDWAREEILSVQGSILGMPPLRTTIAPLLKLLFSCLCKE